MKTLSKEGMFIEGVLIGMLLVYFFISTKITLSFYPYFAGLICILLIGVMFQDKNGN